MQSDLVFYRCLIKGTLKWNLPATWYPIKVTGYCIICGKYSGERWVFRLQTIPRRVVGKADMEISIKVVSPVLVTSTGSTGWAKSMIDGLLRKGVVKRCSCRTRLSWTGRACILKGYRGVVGRNSMGGIRKFYLVGRNQVCFPLVSKDSWCDAKCKFGTHGHRGGPLQTKPVETRRALENELDKVP